MATSISTPEELVFIEAILMAILVRLPPKSIFRFKCVSKTWNHILALPFFLESYYYYHKPKNNHVLGGGGERFLAFIDSSMSHKATFEMLCHCNPYHNPSDTLPLTKNKYYVNQVQMVPERFGHIHHSYNGLILCLEDISGTFYIINPLTRMWVSLPPINVMFLSPTGLTWEENTHSLIPIYKVVKTYKQEIGKEKNKVVIATYCSKSGKWAKSKLVGKEDFHIDTFGIPLVSNGVFYWFAYDGMFAVYDSNRDEKHVQLIKFPHDSCRVRVSDIFSTVSSFDDILWYGWTDRWIDKKMRFWILPKDKQQDGYKHAITVESNEWILMHTICIPSFCQYLDATFVCDAVANDVEFKGIIIHNNKHRKAVKTILRVKRMSTRYVRADSPIYASLLCSQRLQAIMKRLQAIMKRAWLFPQPKNPLESILSVLVCVNLIYKLYRVIHIELPYC